MSGNELTLKDIQKAIKLCSLPENTETKEYDWGWIEWNMLGPKTIKLKKEVHAAFLNLDEFVSNNLINKKGKQIYFDDVPIYVSEDIEDE